MFATHPSIHHEAFCQPLEGIQLSSKEFYQLVEKEIEKCKFPAVSVKRVNLTEGSIGSHNREYLRIRRKNFMFDVCAAQFGTATFISWHLGEETGVMRKLLSRIPFFSRIVKDTPVLKTYYQQDTEKVFIALVKEIIEGYVEHITKDRGLRGLAELKEPMLANQN